jgi:hypothetical protein
MGLGGTMFRSTSTLAEQLIQAGSLRNEDYLEMRHLDPSLITAVYVRMIYFRECLRRSL